MSPPLQARWQCDRDHNQLLKIMADDAGRRGCFLGVLRVICVACGVEVAASCLCGISWGALRPTRCRTAAEPCCKSSSKQRTPGISFHEIPSDPELRAKWLKVISRDDWTPNRTSCYSTVCSRHFGSSDFKAGCKIRKLKKDAVPSIFEEYPAYLQLPKNRERSDGASVRKREAAAPVNTPPPKQRAVESQLESPSLPLNDFPSVDVASQELSLMDCSATELPLPLENGASERCITTTVQVDRAVQVSSLFSVSAMDKRKWRCKERDLNARIERLKNTVDKYKQELQKLKEECYVSAFLQVVEKAKEKDLAASILVEQVQNFAKKKPTWSEVTVRHAVVLRNLSSRAYEHVRSTGILRLPCRSTLERFMGSSRGAVGMTELVKQRLSAELASHPSLHARACSLIVDEMRVKQRLLYHKQRDAFIGEVDYGVNFPKETTNEPVLANSLLCFVLNGLSVSFRVPVAYFFARNCNRKFF
ncbi:hypothetical protein HPB49_009929 [Dermacentor silvarum]|uniref:Uncharacterized protein n=1 Tax=Dermacentor silvarum TaxID=543639 RepID=A0ACB8CR04_DERSI|nr:hypothetical protein HPB49_009929 [Dermacentor silvarum]